MLRYVERVGLVEPERSGAGYRLYGPPELQRLRTLRELLDAHELGLSDVAFALRLRGDAALRGGGRRLARGHAPSVPSDVPGARLAALGAGEALEAAGRRGGTATHRP